MFRKLSVGLLTATFFAVLVGTGLAIASQSVPQNRLSLVLGENCRSIGESCRNDNQCCSGTCEKGSFLPWIPGTCANGDEGGQEELQPTGVTRPTRPPQPTQKPKPQEARNAAFSQQQCQNMNQYTKRLETQLQKAEREMERLREQVQSVQQQANQMCQNQAQPVPTDIETTPGDLPE